MFLLYVIILLSLRVRAFNISVPSKLFVGQPTQLNWTWNKGDEAPIGYVLCSGEVDSRFGCDISSRPRSIRDLENGRGAVNVTAPFAGNFFVSGFTFTLFRGSDPEDDDFQDMFPIFTSPPVIAVNPGEKLNTSTSATPPRTSQTQSSLSSTSASPTPSIALDPVSSSGSGTNSNKARIIGAILGGISALFLGLCIVLCVTITRRRRAKDSMLSPNYIPTQVRTENSLAVGWSMSGPSPTSQVQPYTYDFNHNYHYMPARYSRSSINLDSPQSGPFGGRPELRIIPPAKLMKMRSRSTASNETVSPYMSAGYAFPSPHQSYASPHSAHGDIDSEVVVRHADSGWRGRELPAPPPPQSRRVVEVPPSLLILILTMLYSAKCFNITTPTRMNVNQRTKFTWEWQTNDPDNITVSMYNFGSVGPECLTNPNETLRREEDGAFIKHPNVHGGTISLRTSNMGKYYLCGYSADLTVNPVLELVVIFQSPTFLAVLFGAPTNGDTLDVSGTATAPNPSDTTMTQSPAAVPEARASKTG
ncbi:hypothetical protein VNI00_006737 [Paramarasmius palmivorus]|uniref:Uncharacterized protein n=1 Tax=Paramarasmius palmivorus TaxID=297713 RepID=A0AAW0DAG0_9AGAR